MATVMNLLRLTPSFARDAIHIFFLPLKGWRISAEEHSDLSNQDLSEVYVPIRYINLVRDATCFNQGSFTQYWYLASEEHKKLRIAHDKRQRNAHELTDQRASLVEILNLKFHEAALSNFDFLHRLFDPRNETPPRICIKGYFKTADTDTVITVFRDKPVPYSQITKKEANTGFDYVLKHGKYFLCNDLPRAIAERRYQNPRISQSKAEQYFRNRWIKPRAAWAKAWIDYKSNSDQTDYYQSTLIVPMTLWNNGLDERFLKALEILPNKKRTIMGFLCFDHPHRDYFREELDVSLAYIFADTLALYLFARLSFIEMSNTFRSTENFLDGEKIELHATDLIEMLKKIASRNADIESVKTIQESSEEENFIYEVDKTLMAYIEAIQAEAKSNPILGALHLPAARQ